MYPGFRLHRNIAAQVEAGISYLTIDYFMLRSGTSERR